MDPQILLDHCVAPALRQLDLDSPEARALVMGTAAAESGLVHYRQLGDGPALGLWQVEPDTFHDCWINFLVFRPELAASLRVLGYTGHKNDLLHNPWIGAAFCRIKYRRAPGILPPADDVEAQAAYWKQHYNTEEGAGTVDHYVDSFDLVADALGWGRKEWSPAG